MMRSNMLIFLFAFLVDGVFGDTEEVKSMMEGNSVTLYTDVTKEHDDIMRWYFNNTRLALINGGPSTSCVYDGEGGRFIDRLEVDYETGSLNITNITSEHAGRYEAEIIRIKTQGTTWKMNRTSKCNSTNIINKTSNPKDIIKSFSLTVSASDSGENKNKGLTDPQDKEMETSSGPSTGLVAGIVVGVVVVVLLVAAVVFRKKIAHFIFRKCYIFRKFKEIPTSERTTV